MMKLFYHRIIRNDDAILAARRNRSLRSISRPLSKYCYLIKSDNEEARRHGASRKINMIFDFTRTICCAGYITSAE